MRDIQGRYFNMMTNFVFLGSLCVLFLGAASFVFAQGGPSKNMQAENAKLHEEMQRHQKNFLENLKKMDPNAYEKQKRNIEAQDKLSQIVQSFREKKIDTDNAFRQMYPLVKELSQDDIKGLEERIKRLKLHLGELEKFKQNPDLLIRKRIDQMLGKGDPASDPSMMIPY